MLALKGGRLEEADRRFSILLEDVDEPVVWCALGITKLARLRTGLGTVAEVAHCLGIARDQCSSPDDRYALEQMAGAAVIATVQQLYIDYFQSAQAATWAKQQMTTGAVVTGIASAIGIVSSDLFVELSSFAAASGGVGLIVAGAQDQQSSLLSQTASWNLIVEVTGFWHVFVDSSSPAFLPVSSELEAMYRRANGHTATNEVTKASPVASESGDTNLGGIWFIQRGNEQFSAPDLATLRQWWREHRVFPTDLIHHRSFGDVWMRAADAPLLRM